MTIKPIGNRLVVHLIKQAQTSASGIIISSQDKHEQARGKIIAIGEGFGNKENILDLNLSVGQTIVFGKYAGEEIIDSVDQDNIYKILSTKEILAVIEE